MKKIVILISSILLCGSLFSQKNKIDSLNTIIQNIPYVFEGKIINVTFYPGDKEGNRIPLNNIEWEDGKGFFKLPDNTRAFNYSVATIQICKIFKGDNKLYVDTINFVTSTDGLRLTLSPKANGDTVLINRIVTDGSTKDIILPIEITSRKIFFLNQLNEIKSIPNYFKIVESDGLGLGYNVWNSYYPYATGFDKKFNSQLEVDAFLSQFSSLNINCVNNCDDFSIKKFRFINSMPSDSTNNIPLKNSQKEIKKKIKIGKGNGIILEIKNQRLTGSNQIPYLTFDVFVSATSNALFFEMGRVLIKYNTSVFGTNIFSNNNIEILRGSNFDNTSYFDPNLSDMATDTLSLALGSNNFANNFERTALTINPIILFTVSIKIQNCSTLPEIQLAEPISGLNSLYFTTIKDEGAGESIGTLHPFTSHQFSGYFNTEICHPVIDDFSKYVDAGTNEILTITGDNFGETKDLGSVIFRNANEGNVYPPLSGPNSGGIQFYDVQSWSNKEIKIKLPSIIDSVYDESYKILVPLPTPGSGKFKVLNKFGYLKETSTDLIIPFAITQRINNDYGYKKYKVYLKGESSAGGYTIHINPAVLNKYGTDCKTAIERSIKDWACASRIHWVLGSDTNVATNGDKTCMVNLGVLPSGILQRTVVTTDLCFDGTTAESFLESFDIIIDSTKDWVFNLTGNLVSGKDDFYQSFAHELGHGHLLEHINESTDEIMYYGFAQGSLTNTYRRTVWNSYGSITGSRYVTDYRIKTLYCRNSHRDSTISNCQGFPFSINDETSNNLFNIYPNPVNNKLSISYSIDKTSNIQICLLDITGAIKQNIELKNQNQGEYIEDIQMNDLPSGFYLLQFKINDNMFVEKLIKM